MCYVKTAYMCTGAYAFVHTYIYMPTHVFIAVNILYFRNHVAAGRHIVIPAIICGKKNARNWPLIHRLILYLACFVMQGISSYLEFSKQTHKGRWLSEALQRVM